jgi:hypothetical protein
VQVQVNATANIAQWHEYLRDQQKEAMMVIYKSTQNIKREVVQILRQVVDYVSKAATVLPENIQAVVKRFILALPDRWATLTSKESQLIESKDNNYLTYSHHVMVLANESVIMLQSIRTLVSGYLGGNVKMENKIH